MDKITISVQILNQVMGYLGSRPYQEVYQLITALQDGLKNNLLLRRMNSGLPDCS